QRRIFAKHPRGGLEFLAEHPGQRAGIAVRRESGKFRQDHGDRSAGAGTAGEQVRQGAGAGARDSERGRVPDCRPGQRDAPHRSPQVRPVGRERAGSAERTRYRPVLMTILTAIFGLLPAALSTRIGAQTQRPLAIVVIGGMLTAVVLTRYITPVLYEVLRKR